MDFKVYFRVENNCLQSKTPHNFHVNDENGMIQSFPLIYVWISKNQFQIFVYEKIDFLNLPRFLSLEK